MNNGPMETQVRRKVPWKRILAAILAVVLLTVSALSAMIEVRISSSDSSMLAKNYLINENPYINEGKTDRILSKIKSLRRATDYDEAYSQACVQIAEEKYEDALVSLDACLEYLDAYDPELGEDDVLTMNKSELKEDALIKKGCILELLERNEEAITVLEKAENVLNGTKRAQIHALLAQLYFMKEDYVTSCTYYEKLIGEIKDDEMLPLYLYMYGMAQVQNEDYEQAERLLSEAIDAGEGQEGIRYYRGISRLFLEKYEDAIEDFTTSIEQGFMVQAASYSRAVANLNLNPEELEGPEKDLKLAVNYSEQDRDSTIADQAQQLLDAIKETKEKMRENGKEGETENETKK